jgi:hypothetical protein
MLPLRDPRWQRLRFALGIAQMTGATIAFVLLITNGASRETLYAAILATLLTVTSLLLFGGSRSGK